MDSLPEPLSDCQSTLWSVKLTSSRMPIRATVSRAPVKSLVCVVSFVTSCSAMMATPSGMMTFSAKRHVDLYITEALDRSVSSWSISTMSRTMSVDNFNSSRIWRWYETWSENKTRYQSNIKIKLKCSTDCLTLTDKVWLADQVWLAD